jgi:hypothetical protein
MDGEVARTDGFTFVMSWAFIVGAAIIAVALFATPPAVKAPVVSGLVVVVLACGAAVTGRNPQRKFMALLIGGVFALGLVLAEFHRTALGGVAVMTLAVAAAPLAHYLSGLEPWARVHRGTVVLRLVIGLSVAAVPLSAVGLVEANSATFVVQFGQPVVVSAATSCTDIQIIDPGGRTVSGSTCPGSTWTANGATVTGDLNTAYQELSDRTGGASRQVPAFARGTVAYTPATIVVTDWFGWLGFIPWWLALPAPVLMVLLGMRRPAPVFRTTYASSY